MSLWRRNLAFCKLAIQTNTEYRLNFITDTFLQPFITSLIELTLWFAVFASISSDTFGGFTREYYLSYALWAAFFARAAVSWMYEHRMIEEIDSGSINGILVRPMSFFEYYLSQLMGYKLVTIAVSVLFPALACWAFDLPFSLSRAPLAILLVLYYLVLVHILSVLVASLAFSLNRVHSFTSAKNLALWLMTGELIPLDLLPANIRDVIISLPFSSAVYLPVGYITGRVDTDLVLQGFVSVTVGMAVAGPITYLVWRRGLNKYVGTGA